MHTSTRLFIIFSLMTLTVWANNTLSLENEFIRVDVNNRAYNTGRFSIQTTQGNPATPLDDDQPLSLGKPYPWSSYTTFLIDGNPVVFGGVASKRAGKNSITGTVTRQAVIGDTIQTTVHYNTITLTQTLQMVRNPSTLVKDLVLIDYTAHNTDTQAHTIGARIMMDTWLGSNDAAPFRVGERSIQSESIIKDYPVDYWLTFDSLQKPTVIAQGLIRNPRLKITPPNRTAYVNWGTLADAVWDFSYITGRSFIRSGESEPDTALAMYWDPIELPPNGTRVIRTAYGLGGVTLSPGALSLGLTAPAEHYFNDAAPIPIVAYVQNSGGFDSSDTVLSLDIPKGFVLVEGETPHTIGWLAVNETRQVVFKLQPKQPGKGPHTIALKATSSTLPSNSTQRSLATITPPKPTHALSIEQLSANYYKIIVTITNASPHALLDLNYRLTLPDGFKFAWFESNNKPILALSDASQKQLSWVIHGNSHPGDAQLALIESYAGIGTHEYLHSLTLAID